MRGTETERAKLCERESEMDKLIKRDGEAETERYGYRMNRHIYKRSERDTQREIDR